jgi:hypothetical protein
MKKTSRFGTNIVRFGTNCVRFGTKTKTYVASHLAVKNKTFALLAYKHSSVTSFHVQY